MEASIVCQLLATFRQAVAPAEEGYLLGPIPMWR